MSSKTYRLSHPMKIAIGSHVTRWRKTELCFIILEMIHQLGNIFAPIFVQYHTYVSNVQELNRILYNCCRDVKKHNYFLTFYAFLI